MHAPISGRVFVLPAILQSLDVPAADSASGHVRNAITLLDLLRQISPATYYLNPALERAQRRAETARVMLEHNAPSQFVARHLRSAIESLLDVDMDWQVITEIPAACGRLIVALFQVEAT